MSFNFRESFGLISLNSQIRNYKVWFPRIQVEVIGCTLIVLYLSNVGSVVGRTTEFFLLRHRLLATTEARYTLFTIIPPNFPLKFFFLTTLTSNLCVSVNHTQPTGLRSGFKLSAGSSFGVWGYGLYFSPQLHHSPSLFLFTSSTLSDDSWVSLQTLQTAFVICSGTFNLCLFSFFCRSCSARCFKRSLAQKHFLSATRVGKETWISETVVSHSEVCVDF